MMKFLQNNKKTLIIFVLAIILSFFFIESLLSLIIKLGESVSYKSNLFKVGFFLLAIMTLLLYVNLINKKYIHKNNVSFIIYYIALMYILIRFTDIDNYNITLISVSNQRSTLSYLKYADIILLITFLHTFNVLLVLIKKNSRRKEQSFYIEDTLYYNETIDNEKILLQLIETVSNFKPDPAFSIGLNAIWGYGKSSFLHRFKLLYTDKHPDSIVFWYRIWKNKGSNSIIENFFEELKNNLKPYSAEIANEIDHYVDAILNLSSSDLKKLNDFGKSFLNENETLESFYLDINNIITTIDKQIIILLDDLDRLEKEEIMNTLKLIRTLSDFNNVIFIAGYDRSYIVDTIDIKKINYLDKVFNVEIDLLSFNSELIINELLRLVDNHFPKNIYSEDKTDIYVAFKNLFENSNENNSVIDLNIETVVSMRNSTEAINTNVPIYTLSYKDFLITYRDVKRFINEFKFSIALLGETRNVVIEEYILLKLLIYKFRDLQNSLFSSPNRIFDKGQIDNVNKNVQILGTTLSNDVYLYNTKVQQNLKNNLLKDYKDQDFKLIDAVLNRLFGEKSTDYYEANQNTISKVFYTDIYIRNNIAGNLISISALHTAFFENKLFELVSEIDATRNNNLFSIINEVKQFIFNNRPKTKEQYLDSIKTLNFIISYHNASDDRETLEMLMYVFKMLYNSDKQNFKQDIFNIIKIKSINYLDLLLGELNINLVRKRDLDNYNNIYPDLFDLSDINFLFIEKLKFLIKTKSQPSVIIDYYLSYPKYLVLDKQIVYSEEANELIKNDIEKRFRQYFNSKLFQSLKENGLDKNTAEFIGYSPYFAIAQIFSDRAVLLELVANQNKEIYTKFYRVGWERLIKFLKFKEEEEEEEEEDEVYKFDVEEISKAIKFIKKYQANNYIPLNTSQYSDVWLPF